MRHKLSVLISFYILALGGSVTAFAAYPLQSLDLSHEDESEEHFHETPVNKVVRGDLTPQEYLRLYNQFFNPDKDDPLLLAQQGLDYIHPDIATQVDNRLAQLETVSIEPQVFSYFPRARLFGNVSLFSQPSPRATCGHRVCEPYWLNGPYGEVYGKTFNGTVICHRSTYSCLSANDTQCGKDPVYCTQHHEYKPVPAVIQSWSSLGVLGRGLEDVRRSYNHGTCAWDGAIPNEKQLYAIDVGIVDRGFAARDLVAKFGDQGVYSRVGFRMTVNNASRGAPGLFYHKIINAEAIFSFRDRNGYTKDKVVAMQHLGSYNGYDTVFYDWDESGEYNFWNAVSRDEQGHEMNYYAYNVNGSPVHSYDPSRHSFKVDNRAPWVNSASVNSENKLVIQADDNYSGVFGARVKIRTQDGWESGYRDFLLQDNPDGWAIPVNNAIEVQVQVFDRAYNLSSPVTCKAKIPHVARAELIEPRDYYGQTSIIRGDGKAVNETDGELSATGYIVEYKFTQNSNPSVGEWQAANNLNWFVRANIVRENGTWWFHVKTNDGKIASASVNVRFVDNTKPNLTVNWDKSPKRETDLILKATDWQSGVKQYAVSESKLSDPLKQAKWQASNQFRVDTNKPYYCYAMDYANNVAEVVADVKSLDRYKPSIKEIVVTNG